MRNFIIFLAAISLNFSLHAQQVGEKIPALKISKWVQGEALSPDKGDGKTFYILDFWATWCKPCIKSIPKLNRLQRQYKNLKVISITNEKENIVKAFLKKADMQTTVAIDDANKTGRTWNVKSIPHIVIVDSNGMAVWQGNPFNNIEPIIEQVSTGSFDLKKFVQKHKKITALQKEFVDASKKKNYAKMLEAVKKVIAADPGVIRYHTIYIDLLKAYMPEADIDQAYKEWEEACAEDYNKLAEMARYLIRQEDAQGFKIEMALRSARKAVDLCEAKRLKPIMVLTEVYQELGMFEKAVETLDKGLQVDPENDALKSLKERLEKIIAFRKNSKI